MNNGWSLLDLGPLSVVQKLVKVGTVFLTPLFLWWIKMPGFQMGAGEGQDGEPRVFVKCSYCTNFKSGMREYHSSVGLVPHRLVLKKGFHYRFFGFVPVVTVPDVIICSFSFRRRYSLTSWIPSIWSIKIGNYGTPGTFILDRDRLRKLAFCVKLKFKL